MRFNVHGPFELDKTKQGLIDARTDSRKEYWEWVDECVPGLPNACGCYVFAIQVARGTLPWYIGKAERQCFRTECLSPHKINHFNNAIAGRRGTPLLIFVPQLTNGGLFRKPTTSSRMAIQELESLLIGMALSRNPNLSNAKGTQMLKQLTVDGFLNGTRKAKGGPAGMLRKILGG